ncbi:MAG TPA: alanine racemase [Symbiobacteriaceae bacterium]|jgi:D-serine deaminase-like pyridoxal phosphate-dependent protein|nr:alanine racemase [Symbiobacteriaceae bacterium]
MRYPELDTPCLIVDLDGAERNIRRVQAGASQAGVQLRPHTKTHKSAYFARMQVEAGARGITCAKLGEAEAMAAAGFDDILIAYPLIGPLKLARLAALARQVRRLIVSLDSDEVAAALSSVGEQLGRPLAVYAELDTGLHRVGRAPGADAVAFCRGLDRFPGIRLAGIMSHAGPTWKAGSPAEILAFVQAEAQMMAGVKAALGRPDLALSVGATPTAHLLHATPGITEARPGTYIFGDRNLIGLGLTTEADCAARVLTTVVSHPVPDRAVVDAGSKSLAMDPYRDGGHGLVAGRPELRVARLSEEHGVLEFPAGVELKVGDRLEIIPNHICPAVNLFDRVYGVRAGRVVAEIPVEGRGKST